MPTKRLRIARSRRRVQVRPVLWARLNDEPCPPDAHGFDRVLHYDFPRDNVLQPPWEEHRAAILERWLKHRPGTRPSCWWRFDAPRFQDGDEDCFWHEEPRLRLGGRGTPCHEVLNYVPHFDLGMPTSWVDSWMVEYYNGRAVDVHGNRIGTEYHDGHFPAEHFALNDPPQFESQAAYLDRHALLSPSERRRLRREDFEPEVLPAEFWPDTE